MLRHTVCACLTAVFQQYSVRCQVSKQILKLARIGEHRMAGHNRLFGKDLGAVLTAIAKSNE